ncbi:hemerythrin domain-containing protein [Rhodobacteraceae bacterium CCMM004]|nr:hemerythrin domain-containing protein [Rhodobacteraceae bacterium CCMM004]
MDDDLSLERRTGLPDALRVLAETLPRDGWEGHDNFTALTRFWLDRHLMFRDVLGRLRTGAEAYLDGRAEDRRHAGEVARYGGFLLNELMAHHHIEDAHYFPQLSELDARLTRGFTLLDADHHALDDHIRGLADGANAYLTAQGRDTAGALHAGLGRFETFLDRHLTDEEDLVVPVILTYAPPLG